MRLSLPDGGAITLGGDGDAGELGFGGLRRRQRAVRCAEAQRERERLAALAGLRAVAAYGIVATHVAFQTATGSAVLERFDYFVAVFFALSAFLLARGGLREGYYSRRVARLAPAYVVCVAVVLLALPPLAGVTWGQAVANLLLVQVYVPHSLIDGLTQMWSLCIEAAFYVVLPLYLRLDGRGRRAALAGSVALGLAWPWAVGGVKPGRSVITRSGCIDGASGSTGSMTSSPSSASSAIVATCPGRMPSWPSAVRARTYFASPRHTTVSRVTTSTLSTAMATCSRPRP